ncbi:hypothetical protein PSEUDO8Z_190128 [Pseudomonas sp. 8Z]|nr:hypothetical protein PSEUDO8Z_190128 [Pseudomonas sp. 8Z]
MQHLLGEAETLGLVEEGGRPRGRNAGHGLSRHRRVARVVGNEQHVVRLAGAHLQLLGFGRERPDHAGGVAGEKLHPHLALMRLGSGRPAIDVEGAAHGVIEPWQDEQAEAEHDHHHSQKTHEQTRRVAGVCNARALGCACSAWVFHFTSGGVQHGVLGADARVRAEAGGHQALPDGLKYRQVPGAAVRLASRDGGAVGKIERQVRHGLRKCPRGGYDALA